MVHPGVAAPVPHTRRTEMDELYNATVRRMMEAHGYRALAAAHLLGHGMQYVTAVRYLTPLAAHAHGLAEHYATVARIYQGFTGDTLERTVAARLAQRPAPLAGSWCELALAEFLYGRAVLWLLREHDACSFVPYRELALRLSRDEAGWQVSAAQAVVDACTLEGDTPARRAWLLRWLREGLQAFGRRNTPGGVYAISRGLKKRDPGAVTADYLADIQVTLQNAGVQLPDAKALGGDMAWVVTSDTAQEWIPGGMDNGARADAPTEGREDA